MSSQPIWPITPHTAAKHDILRGYLNAWFPILSKFAGRVVFLDGFAGPGTYKGGEDGSPLVALKALIEHAAFDEMITRTEFVFRFNEVKPKRLASLREEIRDYEAELEGFDPKIKISITGQRFSSMAESIIDQVHRRGGRLAPTFAFVDPFGCKDVVMSQLAELLSHDRCELFIFFNFNFVNRWSSSGEVDDVLTEIFGTDEYREAPPAGHPGRHDFLLHLYIRQLHQRMNFRYVQPFRMINGKGITGHYMVFATRHIAGLTKMKQAMWKVDPTGDYKFSDRLAGQEVLLGFEVDTRPLRKALLEQFGGRTVSIEEVTEWVLEHTIYLDTHVKTKTLKPMQDDGMITSPNQARKGQFPPRTLVTFALPV
jgi:three-Cys-motif partner protein